MFERNQGQAAKGTRFLARAHGRTILFEDRQITMVGPHSRVSLVFDGASATSRISGEAALKTRFHYLPAADPASWIQGVETFSSLRYHNIYPGIDFLVHATGGALEYDLVVQPGANPRAVSFRFEGGGRAGLAEGGVIRVPAEDGAIVQHRPVAYQESGKGRRALVQARYTQQRDGSFRYRLGGYDASRQLVIDPIIAFSTFVGFTAPQTPGNEIPSYSNQFVDPNYDDFTPFAVDAQGYIYVGGTVSKEEFPFPVQHLNPGQGSGMICKVNPADSSISFCTIGWNRISAIRVDAAGSLYVGGTGFVAKVAPQGDQVLWTYSTGDIRPIAGLAVDPSGAVVFAGGLAGNLIYKVKPNGSGAFTPTTLGTAWYDWATAIATDSLGNIYVTGRVGSEDFPRTAGMAYEIGTGVHTYVVKLDPVGQLLYSYILPQHKSLLPKILDAETLPSAIAVDSNDSAYVVGTTSAADLPVTAGALQPTNGGSTREGFVLKLNAAGTSLDYLSYLGGAGKDDVTDIAVDDAGNVYLTGSTQGGGFPTNDTTGSPALPVGSTAAFFVPKTSGGYQRATDGWASRINSMAINPVNPLVVYASSGYQGQVLKSTDGGRNWSNLPSPGNEWIDRIVLDPVNPDIVWAASTDKFWRSLDAGASWAAVAIPLNNLNGMKVDPVNPAIRYAVGFANNRPAVVRSSNSGATWQALGLLEPGHSCYWFVCGASDLWINPANPSFLAAATDSGVFESTNAGQTWTPLAQIHDAQMVDTRFDPTNSQVVWGAGYGGIRKSTDRGHSWSTVYSDFGGSARAVIPHPLGGSVYAATGQDYDNVIESKDGGATWTHVGIPAPVYWGVAEPTEAGKYILGGASPLHPFVTKLTPGGGSFVYSGFFGGSHDDLGTGIGLDGQGRVHVGGLTASPDFPLTQGAPQTAFGGQRAWFVARLADGPASSVKVQVTPAAVTLGLGQSQQFTAAVTGASDGVTWSLRPAGAGTISASGLYTAPAAAASNPVTVIATSVQDPTQQGQAAVSLPNPSPILNSLDRTSATPGSQGFHLTLTGANFVPGSVVQWNGAVRNTKYLSSNSLRADIFQADLETPGIVPVTVNNKAPGGGTSAARMFTIPNPAPVAIRLWSTTGIAWSPGEQISVAGTDFVSSSVVRFNGQDRPTTFIGSTLLFASLPASDLLGASTNTVTVYTPAPGGGESAALTYVVVDALPRTIGVTPYAGSGQAASFQASYAWGSDYRRLRWVQLLVAAAPDGGQLPFCFVHYDTVGKGFWIYGEGGFFEGPVTPGTASTALQNSFCALNAQTSMAAGSGGTLTLKADLVFKAAGARNLYLSAGSAVAENTGWKHHGSWTAQAAPLGGSLVQPAAGTGLQQTFQLTYNDPVGFTGTQGGWQQFLVAAAPDGGGQSFCFFHYDRAGNGIWMYSSDAGFFLGPVQPGVASNVLDSSACSVNSAATTLSAQAGALLINVPMTFKGPMSGARNLYLRTMDPLRRDSGWTPAGTWTIP
ncbi:SBBP repeat-containing protein [Paludibaculum fermentans]|uniref:DUF7948 domain-containing protein n=1 Tax=Paludibaculum fermentans TaxID=1473598 RepID=UPI003EBC95CD